MIQKGAHRWVWYYGLVYEMSETMNHIVHGPDKQLGLEQVTGDLVDILEWLDFEFGIGTLILQRMLVKRMQRSDVGLRFHIELAVTCVIG